MRTVHHHEAVRLREYHSGDLEAIFELDQICFAEPFRFALETMRWFVEARNALTVIAERGTETAGFCIAHVERNDNVRVGYVVTLDVRYSERRRGLAQRLMREVETQAREAGCNSMTLHVSVGNKGAIRFYERLGYIRSQEVPDFYGKGFAAWTYYKALQ